MNTYTRIADTEDQKRERLRSMHEAGRITTDAYVWHLEQLACRVCSDLRRAGERLETTENTTTD